MDFTLSPEIEDITWEQTGPGTVLFEWDATDPDQDYLWPPADRGALMRYRYRVDKGPWYVFDTEELDTETHHYVQFVEVEDIGVGDHTFTLQAFNQEYFTSRSDEMIIDFNVD